MGQKCIKECLFTPRPLRPRTRTINPLIHFILKLYGGENKLCTLVCLGLCGAKIRMRMCVFVFGETVCVCVCVWTYCSLSGPLSVSNKEGPLCLLSGKKALSQATMISLSQIYSSCYCLMRHFLSLTFWHQSAAGLNLYFLARNSNKNDINSETAVVDELVSSCFKLSSINCVEV